MIESIMAKRRKAIAVTLTDDQRQRLERLWFIYGNYGPKTTPGNHSFIQGLLEYGTDLRPLITKRTRKSEIPTPECEAAVDQVLAEGNAPEARDERAGGVLRVVSSSEDRPHISPSTELKEILDDIKRRRRGASENNRDEDDTPDAA